jgi:ankyrin repeat protein
MRSLFLLHILCLFALESALCQNQSPNLIDHQMMSDALVKCDLTTVKKVLKAPSVDPNDMYNPHQSYLGAAAAQGCDEIVKLLIKKGAKGTKLVDNQTALFSAAITGHPHALKILLDALQKETSSTPEFMGYLNLTNSWKEGPYSGFTLLRAIPEGLEHPNAWLEETKMLIEAGADPNITDERGYTVLYRLQHHSIPVPPEVIKYLIDHGAQ